MGIKEEAELIRQEHKINGHSERVDDDVRRYAIPNYITKLGGTRKSRSTYRYTGLDNIIHLSSGLVRYLLDSVSDMYEQAVSVNPGKEILYIETSIQNQVLRSQADTFLYSELLKSNDVNNEDDLLSPINAPSNDVEKLQNLISAMGKTFHELLISDRAERKVFSIALSNVPDSELRRVFNVGIRLGFLHKARIGNKDGTGRTQLYILNRCFAPLFILDPTGFQGYLFVTNRALHEAIQTGKPFRKISDDTDDIYQLTLDDVWED